MNLAENPWVETPYGKKEMYLRGAVKWDKRVMGKRGLSPAQRAAVAAFTEKAHEAKAKCADLSGMKANICRIEYIKDHLSGATYKGAKKKKAKGE